jgi:tetratricopeptide (TPR) repeat protein
VVSYVKYLSKTFYPVELAVIYPVPRGIPWEQVVIATALLAVVSWLVWRMRRRKPYLLMGWLWFLGMLVPVSGLAQVGTQAMADRFTYLPLVGVYIGMIFSLGDLTAKLRPAPVLLISVGGIVLAGCLVLTARQLQYWQDSETLFRHALRVTRDNPSAQSYLGNILLQKGQVDEALAHLQASIELEPNNSQAHNNLGWALLPKGRVDEAIAQFQKALEIQPRSAAIHYNLGVAFSQKEQVGKAIEQYQEAVDLQPDFVQARNNLGDALLRTGRTDGAIAQFQAALKIRPDSAILRNNLGLAFLRKGQAAEAVAHFQGTLSIEPHNVDACHYLAWILATCPEPSIRNGAKAVELAREVDRFSGGEDPEIAGTLAAAYAEAGRFPEAVATAQQALQLAAVQTNTAAVDALRAQIGFYQAGLPFRDPSLTNALPAGGRP